MAINFYFSEITQHRVEFYTDTNALIVITLTKDCDAWDLGIVKETELTVEEIIEICKIVYSQKVIDENDCIVIAFNSKNPTYIYGAEEITSKILKSVTVTFPVKNKR